MKLEFVCVKREEFSVSWVILLVHYWVVKWNGCFGWLGRKVCGFGLLEFSFCFVYWVLSLFLFIWFDLWRLRLYGSNWGIQIFCLVKKKKKKKKRGVQLETWLETRKTNPITDPFFFFFGSGWVSDSQTQLISGWGSGHNKSNLTRPKLTPNVEHPLLHIKARASHVRTWDFAMWCISSFCLPPYSLII